MKNVMSSLKVTWTVCRIVLRPIISTYSRNQNSFSVDHWSAAGPRLVKQHRDWLINCLSIVKVVDVCCSEPSSSRRSAVKVERCRWCVLQVDFTRRWPILDVWGRGEREREQMIFCWPGHEKIHARTGATVWLIHALTDSTLLTIINFKWLRYHITGQLQISDRESDQFPSTLTHLKRHFRWRC